MNYLFVSIVSIIGLLGNTPTYAQISPISLQGEARGLADDDATNTGDYILTSGDNLLINQINATIHGYNRTIQQKILIAIIKLLQKDIKNQTYPTIELGGDVGTKCNPMVLKQISINRLEYILISILQKNLNGDSNNASLQDIKCIKEYFRRQTYSDSSSEYVGEVLYPTVIIGKSSYLVAMQVASRRFSISHPDSQTEVYYLHYKEYDEDKKQSYDGSGIVYIKSNNPSPIHMSSLLGFKGDKISPNGCKLKDVTKNDEALAMFYYGNQVAKLYSYQFINTSSSENDPGECNIYFACQNSGCIYKRFNDGLFDGVERDDFGNYNTAKK